MSSKSDLRKVRIDLERRPSAGFPPFDYERLWVEDLGAGRFRVANIPFYPLGLNLGDVVSLRPADGGAEPYIDKVLEWGGHSTFHFFFPAENHESMERVMSGITEAVMGLGCSIEHAGEHYFSIDVPPDHRKDLIVHLLDVGAEDGVWRYEDATEYARRES